MAEITSKMVMELREKTGAGMMDCKKALQEVGGDIEQAKTVLRKKGLADAAKRTARATNAGAVASYIHLGGRIGVLIEVNCETDFVARLDDFQTLVKDLSMQVAASAPRYVAREDVPEEVVAREKEIYASQITGKPENIVEKIITGKLDKFYQQVCLLEQPFIREDKKSVGELVKNFVAKTGENCQVRRFVRFELGEDLD